MALPFLPQARDPEAEHTRLSRRVARIERSAEALRHKIAEQGITKSAETVEELAAQERALAMSQEQLVVLQAEVDERRQRREEKAEIEEAARLGVASTTPLRASSDPAEQARLEEM